MDTQPAPNLQSEPSQTEIAVQAPPDDSFDRFECRPCGYVYEPLKGDNTKNIAPGTAFAELPDTWRCPVCGAPAKAFANIGPAGTASGFKENYGYGFGVNTLTPNQKSLLIFGALALGFLIMMSLYSLG
jgi:rubredoxin